MSELPKCYRCGCQPCECADGITLYHADCRDVLPLLPKVDLVLTDPPYGIGALTDRRQLCAKTGIYAGRHFPPVTGDDKPFDPRPFLPLAADVVLFGANHFAALLPSSAAWFVWDKRNGAKSDQFSDCELAWRSRGGSVRIFRHLWKGGITASERHRKLHPTQKPVVLMRWCLGFYPDAAIILDPFTGSGTTLRAAKDLGRKAIGIEIEEEYCEIAANRLRQEVLF